LQTVTANSPVLQVEYIEDVLASLEDRRVLPLLTALLHSPHDDVVLAAIELIESFKEPGTIPLLEQRACYDPVPLVRHAAQNAALRLQVRLADHEQKLPPSQLWTAPVSEPIVRILESSIDGSGGQVIFLARELPNGEWRVLDLLFNDHEGLKDAFCIVVTEEALGEIVGEFDACDFVDITLDRCRQEIERTYRIALEAQRRLPMFFFIWRGMLDGDDPRDVEEYPVPVLDERMQVEMLSAGGELADLEEFDFWFFNPVEVEAFVPRYLGLDAHGVPDAQDQALGQLLDEANVAIMGEGYRQLLPDRLRRQAWFLAQLYEDPEVPLWALAAASAIEQGIIAGNPFLRRIMQFSLVNASAPEV
jgi:hypothetical protein